MVETVRLGQLQQIPYLCRDYACLVTQVT